MFELLISVTITFRNRGERSRPDRYYFKAVQAVAVR